MDKIPVLVSRHWDESLAKMSYREMRDGCLFAVIWSERKQGGYNSHDFFPFVAMKKIVNEGVEAYDGISLGMTYDVHGEGKDAVRYRKVQVHSRTYYPVKNLGLEHERMTVVANPDEILETFLKRWDTPNA